MATNIKPLHDRVIIRRIEGHYKSDCRRALYSRFGKGKTARRRSYRRRSWKI
jgi:hypothetical protein